MCEKERQKMSIEMPEEMRYVARNQNNVRGYARKNVRRCVRKIIENVIRYARKDVKRCARKGYEKICQKRMPEDVPERMSEEMSGICQKEYQKNVR